MADGDNGMERRDFLKTAGATAAAATTTATAGCISSLTGGGGGGSLVYARGDHPENYDPQQTTSGEDDPLFACNLAASVRTR